MSKIDKVEGVDESVIGPADAQPDSVGEEYKPLEEPSREADSSDPSPAQKQDTMEFDYIIPAETFKHHSKKRRRKRKSKTPEQKSKSDQLLDEATDGYVFAKPVKRKHRRHHKKWPLWLKIIVIVVSVILSLAILATATFFILRSIGKSAMHNYDNIDIVIPVQDDSGNDAGVLDSGRTIKYGGKTYRLNEDVMTVTFIGYKEGEESENGNNMADAIYIAAIDDYTGKTTIIGVSRDTMLDVDVFSASGHFIDTEKMQLSYAYSYGSDTISGGENLNTSLTRLFFGLPFNNYFAIDLDALEELNDAIGGVTLTSKMTFDSEWYGRTVQEGEEITLHGKDAVTYVQSREYDPVDANNARMERQQQYIKAFLASIVPAAKKDISTVTDLFGAVRKNSDTSLDLPKVTYLATAALSKMRNANEIEYVRLDGTVKAGEHAELYLNDKDVLETMLKIFYTPVE